MEPVLYGALALALAGNPSGPESLQELFSRAEKRAEAHDANISLTLPTSPGVQPRPTLYRRRARMGWLGSEPAVRQLSILGDEAAAAYRRLDVATRVYGYQTPDAGFCEFSEGLVHTSTGNTCGWGMEETPPCPPALERDARVELCAWDLTAAQTRKDP